MAEVGSYKKTGLAARMREWMKGRKRPFTARMICDGLEISGWDERQKVHNSIPDFLKRGEVYQHQRGQISNLSPNQQKRRQNKQYKYNHGWRKAPKGKDKPRILKAMYISAMEFAASDIERLSGAGRNHVEKIIKSLVTDGDLSSSAGGHAPRESEPSTCITLRTVTGLRSR